MFRSHAPLNKSLWPGERMNGIVGPKPQLEVDSALPEPHRSPNRFWVDKEVNREKRKLRRPLSKDHDNRWEREAILLWKAAGAKCSKGFPIGDLEHMLCKPNLVRLMSYKLTFINKHEKQSLPLEFCDFIKHLMLYFSALRRETFLFMHFSHFQHALNRNREYIFFSF